MSLLADWRNILSILTRVYFLHFLKLCSLKILHMNKSLILTQITAEELQCEFKQIMQSIISLEQKIKIPNPARELMTIDEVAKYFKKHKDTIENWTRKGFLVKYGIENSIYYRRSEVENALTPLKR